MFEYSLYYVYYCDKISIMHIYQCNFNSQMMIDKTNVNNSARSSNNSARIKC